MNGAIPGQRFVVDLSDDEEDHDATTSANTRANASSSQQQSQPLPANPLEFIKDIVEREPTTPKAPSLPTFKHKPTPTGFPVHKKRVSKFKQSRQIPSTEAFDAFAKTSVPQTFNLPEPAPPTPVPATRDGQVRVAASGGIEGETQEEEEMRLIDMENTKRLANMSVSEIEQERSELLSQLDPSLVAMLMKRSNKSSSSSSTATTKNEKPAAPKSQAVAPPKKIEKDIEKYLRSANLDTGRGDTGIEDLGPAPSLDEITKNAVPIPKPRGKPIQPTKAVRWLEEDEKEPDDDEDPLQDSEMKASLQPASEFKPHNHNHGDGEAHAAKCHDPSHDHSHDADGPSVHFPEPKPAPDLDPTDPNFFENLHSTYFPSLPNDPSKLAWMAPLPSEGSPADLESSYNPSHPALPASALRFDFRGALLPPSISRAMPTSKGLHHHADAPEAAGYTIPELARLARSTYPAQRCIAFQVLGRLLYRLGKGIFGQGSEMTIGMWRCIEEGKVLDILQQAAGQEGGHRSVSAYAQEAVWLWQKGGGKVMGAI